MTKRLATAKRGNAEFIQIQKGPDWCHLCGFRKERNPLIEVCYPKNAEHGGPKTEYIRICKGCVTFMFTTFDVYAVVNGHARTIKSRDA
jgi:hypothetical protein